MCYYEDKSFEEIVNLELNKRYNEQISSINEKDAFKEGAKWAISEFIKSLKRNKNILT